MKKLIFPFLLLTACGDGSSPVKCYQHVQEQNPTSQVIPIPNHDFRFLVIDTCGQIKYVETMGLGTKITSEIKLTQCHD